jgi:hypothetical protein
MSSLRIDVRERRARLSVRHHLAPESRADDVVTAVRAQLVLHATDPASVYLGAWARLRHPPMDAVQGALYDDRSLVRMLGMRRTMFVVSVELVPKVQAACTQAIAARERRRTERLLAEAQLTDDAPGWLAEVEQLADDVQPTATPTPHAVLLPGLDSTVMGWESRDWFLGDHAKALFDATVTPGRLSGGAVTSSAAGPNATTATWCCACWRTSAGQPPIRSPERPHGCSSGSARSGSPLAYPSAGVAISCSRWAATTAG